MTTTLPAPRRAWLLYTITLAVIVLGVLHVVRQQAASDLAAAQRATQREITLLASIVEADLQSGNYQSLDDKLSEWGEANRNVLRLTITASNGFILGEYRRPGSAETDPAEALTESRKVRYSYEGEATVSLMRDLAALATNRQRLLAQLGLATLLLAALLAFLLHTLLARQREAQALRRRTTELDAANTALQAEIARRQQTEESLFEAKQRAEVTLHSIGDAVITTDSDGLVDYLNPVAAQLTGWTSEEARGLPLKTVFPIFNELTREPVEAPVERVLREGIIVGLANHTVLITRDNREIAIEDSAAPIRNPAGAIIGVVMVFHDVTASRELASQLSWQASHDTLTGLVNRREFENRLIHALALARNDDQQHALLYLDLDQFKVVNDTCGHIAGDELLRQLSRNLQEHLRSHDTLARLGGDEFGVLLENCPLERARQIAETLRAVTADYRFNWENRRFEIGVSIGIVPIHRQSDGAEGLLAAADMACYAAKESGRNRTHLYRESDTDLRQRHGEMLWVSRLNDALTNDQLLLYRQPIVPLNGSGQTHHEVLVRLRGDDGEIITPGQFLPAAERYGLMPQIDRWVIARTLACLRAQGAADGPLTAVNLSGASLGDERFLEFLHTELTRDGRLPWRLCFEITETVAITNLARAAAFMNDMRNLGCSFALDDFGTGLSSFSYLKHLPIDFLKIDGSLVRGIVDNETDYAMVQAINDIGHTLGVRTVAEYVENGAIRERLAAIHVDYAQGYGIAMPEAWPATH